LWEKAHKKESQGLLNERGKSGLIGHQHGRRETEVWIAEGSDCEFQGRARVVALMAKQEKHEGTG